MARDQGKCADSKRNEQHIERELKYAVSSAENFEALARAAGGDIGEPVTQVNHFFDTADYRLNQTKHTIRLREEAGKFILGAKGPAKSDGTATKKLEEELVIGPACASEILGGRISPLTVLEEHADDVGAVLFAEVREVVGSSKLIYLGSFSNKRSHLAIALPIGGRCVALTFEMDCVTFPGNRIEYEVEVELKKDVDEKLADAAVQNFFNEAKVSWKKAPPKVVRFYSYSGYSENRATI